jgi:hypothetical protein
VALIQRSWVSEQRLVTERWTSLGWRIAGRAHARLHANISFLSFLHRCFLILTKNFNNHKFMNSFKRPSETGRVFFRLYAQGQAASIFKQQYVDATL